MRNMGFEVQTVAGRIMGTPWYLLCMRVHNTQTLQASFSQLSTEEP